jgi:uncharacterized membrane protein YbaN (DUF454 family)
MLYLILGTISLAVGLIGIVVPGLPTTPFLLLTAGLWLRGSTRFYNWLIRNKYLGPYITNWNKNKGLTRSAKIKAIIFQWIMITISIIWGIEKDYVRGIVILAGLIGTYVLIFILPTIKTMKE